jgi:hypothetical protein
VTRLVLLSALRVPGVDALVWMAPRGLITVLLFLAAADAVDLRGFPFGAVMLVVLATSVLVVQSKGVGAATGAAPREHSPRGS